jgi:hypothetical protein|uniref:Uncharacterized protein n=1 Tax=Myoviridae sp. ctqfO1 TaxID=2827710 RepID=A0A8S5T2Y4_9CAUD|nr:MAG TPA: hypothetical protein [Myoviridae sp. ctqfO1]
MTLAEIKAAVFDGAIVRVVGLDYVDTYQIGTTDDGTSLRAYANDEIYSVGDMFDDIERAAESSYVRIFRRDFTDATVITILKRIGEEV